VTMASFVAFAFGLGLAVTMGLKKRKEGTSQVIGAAVQVGLFAVSLEPDEGRPCGKRAAMLADPLDEGVPDGWPHEPAEWAWPADVNGRQDEKDPKDPESMPPADAPRKPDDEERAGGVGQGVAKDVAEHAIPPQRQWPGEVLDGALIVHRFGGSLTIDYEQVPGSGRTASRIIPPL